MTSTSPSTGTGAAGAAQGKILSRPEAQGQTDRQPDDARAWFTRAQRRRRAAGQHPLPQGGRLFAADKTGYQRAYGGTIGGDIATSLLPPLIPGAKTIDLYDSGTSPRATTSRPRPSSQRAVSPTASRPTSPTAPSGRRRRRPPRRCSSRWPRSASSSRSSRTRRPTTPSSTRASPTSPRPTSSASWSTAGAADWPDGFGFLQQIVGQPGDPRGRRQHEPRHQAARGRRACSTRRWRRRTPRLARPSGARSTRPSWRTPTCCRVSGPRALLYRPSNLTNVFVNDAFGAVRLRGHRHDQQVETRTSSPPVQR